MTGMGSTRRRTAPIIAYWLCLFLWLPSWALASPPLKFQRYGLEQGLSQSVVSAIAQDSQGFLWFATQDGLNRFDGYRFTVFRHHAGDATSLSANFVSALLLDHAGGLWIGTELGLDRLLPGTGQFSHENLGPEPLNVNVLLEDSLGTLWVGTNNGLYRREPGGAYVRFGFEPGNDASLSDNRINALAEDGLGNLWVGTDDGLNRLERASGRNTRFAHNPLDPASLSDNRILALHRTPVGRLWVGTANGLNRFNLGKQNFTRYYYADEAHALCDDRVQAIISDPGGQLWIGTENGLCRYREGDDDFVRITSRPADPTSIASDDVVSFFVDRGGLLWIGSYGGGLSQWNPATARFPHYLSGAEGSLPRGKNLVEGLSYDRLGRIWAGTANAGVVVLDREQGKNMRFVHDPRDPSSLASNEVPSIMEDRYGRVWLATHGGGVDVWTPEGNGFTHYRHRADAPDSLSDDQVLAVHEGRRGEIWIGTEAGLDRYLGEGRFERLGEHLPLAYRNIDSRVGVILDSADGTLWAGGEGGLLRRRPGQAEFEHFRAEPGASNGLSHTTVLSLYEDFQGVIWVGTASGLNKIEIKRDNSLNFVAITERDGLPNGVVYAILGDKTGRLWLSTNQGLVRYDPISGHFDHYTLRDGLQSNEFYSMGRAAAGDGEFLFGGLNGFNAFYPDTITRNAHQPRVLFSELKLYHGSGNKTLDIAGRQSLEIPAATRAFSLEFAASDFADPGANRFQARLSGFSDEWVVLDDKHELSFTDLPPGAYRLEIRASNNNDVWSSEPGTLTITVLAPWWRSNLAYVLYSLLLMAACTYGMTLWRRRRLEQQLRHAARRQAEQEQRVALEDDHKALLTYLDRLERTLQERNDESLALTQQLQHVAERDGLTELYNRHHIMLERLRLWGLEHTRGHALMLLDIDGFARLNREFGHAAGDRILVEVAILLRAICPEQAILARWGGDEFFIFVPGAGVEEAEMLAEQIRQRLATHVFTFRDERRGHLSGSLGIACHAFLAGGPEQGFAQALALAERAVIAAKRTSRNAWVLIGPGNDRPPVPLDATADMGELQAAGWVRVSSSLPRGQAVFW